jgi:hypothetical protein
MRNLRHANFDGIIPAQRDSIINNQEGQVEMRRPLPQGNKIA